MSKKSAFTLAEVLITLGVIGVVAAMTIPVVISNTNGAKFRTLFKKSISTLNQAGLMAQAQYGYNFASTSEACPADRATAAEQHPEEAMTFCSILNGTLQGVAYYGSLSNLTTYIKNEERPYTLHTRDTIPDNYTDYLVYTLADGMIVAFHKDAAHCELPIGRRLQQAMFSGSGVDGVNLSTCVGFVDVNGVVPPNREVNCSSGINKVDAGSNCIVDNNANRMLDVYPIVFHDATVEPASGAALFVLDTSKI